MIRKVAIITGATSGIGLALAEQLLTCDSTLHLCLACRNAGKAELIQSQLSNRFPEAEISLLVVDVSNLRSVYEATCLAKQRYEHVDYLYLNAGIMPVSKIDWAHFWTTIFSKHCIHMFRTGDGLLSQVDEDTQDGLKMIFMTNLFGHFVMIKQLLGILGGPERHTQIIWTSSSNAKRGAFNMDDIQHKIGHEPYSASKYAIDLLSVALNEKYNNQGIYSQTTCPGLVMTNLTYGILPAWLWIVFLPIIWLLRLFTSNMTINPHNGAKCLYWMFTTKPQTLDPMAKYHSRYSFTGRRFVETTKLDIDLTDSMNLYSKLDEMEEEIRPKFRS